MRTCHGETFVRCPYAPLVSLAIGCGSRAEFESRLSALADIIDKFQVHDVLLPIMTEEEKIKGSLDKLQIALLHKLSAQAPRGGQQGRPHPAKSTPDPARNPARNRERWRPGGQAAGDRDSRRATQLGR